MKSEIHVFVHPYSEGLRESVPISLKVFVRVDFVLTMKWTVISDKRSNADKKMALAGELYSSLGSCLNDTRGRLFSYL